MRRRRTTRRTAAQTHRADRELPPRTDFRQERVGSVVVGTSLLAVAFATLRPVVAGEGVARLCVLCEPRALADVAVNVLLFVPLGLGLALRGVPARRAVMIGALASALVEAAQLVLPGRDPGVRDVIVNALGTFAGWTLPKVLRHLARPLESRPKRWELLGPAWLAFAILVTGALLAPSFPHATYRGEWTPNLGGHAWYRGSLRDARVGDVPLPASRPLQNSALVRRLLLAGTSVRLTGIAGPQAGRIAPLFRVADEYRREIVFLGVDGPDLVYRFRSGAVLLGFDQPDLRFPGAMREIRAGDSLAVAAWADARGRYCLAGGADTACGLGFTPGSGWSLLYYVRGWRALHPLLDAIWVGALVFPLGVVLRRRWESALAVSLTILTWVALPGVVYLLPADAIETAGGVGGMVIGMLVTTWIQRRSR